jgi:hypothetical protein
MSGAVEKLLLTYLWNRYHEQIPVIKLIQIGAISILFGHHKPLFYCWKDIWCWKLPRRVATSENDRLHIYSLCSSATDELVWSWCVSSSMGTLVILDFEIPKIRPCFSNSRFWEVGVGTWQFWEHNQKRPSSLVRLCMIYGLYCSPRVMGGGVFHYRATPSPQRLSEPCRSSSVRLTITRTRRN